MTSSCENVNREISLHKLPTGPLFHGHMLNVEHERKLLLALDFPFRVPLASLPLEAKNQPVKSQWKDSRNNDNDFFLSTRYFRNVNR